MKIWMMMLLLAFITAIGPSVYGLILAFKASIILGVLALMLEPSPMVFGWIAIFGHADICHKIAQWLHLPL